MNSSCDGIELQGSKRGRECQLVLKISNLFGGGRIKLRRFLDGWAGEETAIQTFADELGIAPGIIGGNFNTGKTAVGGRFDSPEENGNKQCCGGRNQFAPQLPECASCDFDRNSLRCTEPKAP
jgi:hypothetical protein